MGNMMNKVLPGLYIGSARDAHDVEELMQNKISHILSVLESSKPDLPDKEYMCLSIPDSPSQNIASYFAQSNVFIHKARRTGNVLVHCQMGVSRSATIVVAYLMTVTRLSWKDAIAALKAVRPFICPNFGFQKQLMVFEQKNVEEERTRLKTIFPLSQFNDVVHCEQLLEIYRLSQLRNEQPMEVDVYPLALNAYATTDFASLALESTPTNVVFCGPVSNPVNQEECLVQRLEHIHLQETFKSLDTFSCGSRPTSNFIVKTETRNAGILSTSSLSNVEETGSEERERNPVSGNILRPGLLNNMVLQCRANNLNSTNDAALESLFSNSVVVSQVSGKENPLSQSTMQGSLLQKPRSAETEGGTVNGIALPSVSPNNTGLESGSNETKSSNDATLESLFSNSVGISKNPAKDNPVKNKAQESRSQDPDSLNDTAVDSIFSNSVGGPANSSTRQRSKEVKGASAKPQVSSQLTEKDLREIGRAYLRKHVNIWHDMSEADDDEEEEKLSKLKIKSKTPCKMKIISNDPTQNGINGANPSPMKITSNDPAPQITNKDSNQKRLSVSSKEEEITLLPSKSQLDQLFHD